MLVQFKYSCSELTQINGYYNNKTHYIIDHVTYH